MRDKAKEYGLEILTSDWTQYDANHVVTRTPGADVAVIQSVADEYEETMERYMRYQDYLFAQGKLEGYEQQDVPAAAPAVAALAAAAERHDRIAAGLPARSGSASSRRAVAAATGVEADVVAEEIGARARARRARPASRRRTACASRGRSRSFYAGALRSHALKKKRG